MSDDIKAEVTTAMFTLLLAGFMCSLPGFLLGLYVGRSFTRADAVEHGAAYWESNRHGVVKFRWGVKSFVWNDEVGE